MVRASFHAIVETVMLPYPAELDSISPHHPSRRQEDAASVDGDSGVDLTGPPNNYADNNGGG